jgi:hypothetical protein
MPSYETKEAAAARIYPGITFDCALPQPWVDGHAFDVRPHFVWGYPQSYLFGLPLPLTHEGRDWLDETYPAWAERATALRQGALLDEESQP